MGTTNETTRKRPARSKRPTTRTAAVDSQVRRFWLAGLGAVATTGETAVELLDELVARGKKREPATVAAAEKAVRDARRAVESLAAETGRRSMRLVDDAIDRLGIKAQPRRRNILHRLGDVAEALF